MKSNNVIIMYNKLCNKYICKIIIKQLLYMQSNIMYIVM